MSIQVQCIQCGASHRVNDRLAGRRVRCPNCSTVVHVPEQEQPTGGGDGGPHEGDGDTFEDDHAAIEESWEDFAPEAMPGLAAGVSPLNTAVDEPIAKPQTPIDFSSLTIDALDDEDDDLPARAEREEEELDMTPMVDVTFLLLIFFMVTASFSLQKSIEMPRQQTDAPSTSVTEEELEELDMVELQVDEFGSFLVLAADWERETPGKQNLISALKEAMTAGSDGMRLAVKVHELAKLQALVDAMDAGTIAGFTEIEVTQVEDFN